MKPVHTTQAATNARLHTPFTFIWSLCLSLFLLLSSPSLSLSLSLSFCLSFSLPPAPPSRIINFVQFRFTLLQRKVVYIFAAIISFCHCSYTRKVCTSTLSDFKHAYAFDVDQSNLLSREEGLWNIPDTRYKRYGRYKEINGMWYP